MPDKPIQIHRGKWSTRGEEQKRAHISAEAARIMAEEGVRDFQVAKRKAASRLHLPQTKHLPTNEEVQAALQEYLQLFHADRLEQNIHRLRGLALEAMRFLSAFDPRLVGAVLSGTVTADTDIQLHVSADAPEEIGFFLQEHHIPYEIAERRVRFGGERYEGLASYRFSADDVIVEVCVFDPRKGRELPLSPIDGRPMKRANLKEVQALLQPTP